MHQPANVQLLAQTEALNRLFDEKAFSWTLAMENLETVLPGGVQVTTLEPVRAKDGHITLHLRVLGPRDRAVELVRNLEHSKRFLLPRIVGENAESVGGPNEKLEPISASSRVNFDLLAEYNPGSPEERIVKAPQKASPATEAVPRSKPVQLHPVAGLAERPPYTGAPRPVAPGSKPNPALYPARGGSK
jgi:type IV pilus assembly protein PilN